MLIRVILAIAAGTDFVLSLLPTIFLWNIKIHWKIKVGVCGIMALGFAYVLKGAVFCDICSHHNSSGGFAIARTALVPSLTATHDPTCMAYLPHHNNRGRVTNIYTTSRGLSATFYMGNVSSCGWISLRSCSWYSN